MQDELQPRPVSLGTFADYINTPSTDRMKLISQQRSRYLGSDGPAYLPYQAAAAGIRNAIKEQRPEPLQAMIFKATDVMLPHYRELAEGMTVFLQKHRPVFIEARSTTWSYGPLTLTVNQHIGMKIKQQEHVIFPYLKRPVLTADGARVIWRTLEHTRSRTLPDAVVAVLDVRRNKLFKPTQVNRKNLDSCIEVDAWGYVELWRRSAAA